MAWDLSCRDWPDRLRDRRPLIRALPLWQESAEAALAVFRSMHLADVMGSPTIAELGDDWVADLVRSVFGSVDPDTGRRAIREFFPLVPKKNNKTTGAALLMLTALLVNRRRRAKFILAGPTQDAAELAFAAAEGAIKLCPVKGAKLHIRSHLKRIEHRVSGASLEIMTFDPQVLTGQKPAGVLIDELHVCAKNHKAASALRQLRGGMIPISEAFLIMISTQSEEPPVGVFAEELRRARGIRDGRLTGDLLPILYEFPEEMQRDQARWMDPANWHMVNPNWGRSVDAEALQSLHDKAAEKGEHELRAWASQHLNVEIGVALRADGWAGAEYWQPQTDETITFETLLERCDVITVGIDGGGLDDLLGLTLLGRERETGRWLSWSRAWAHPIALKRRPEIASRLQDFAAAGELRIVERVGEDMAELVELCTTTRQRGLLPAKEAIGIDPGNSHSVVVALQEAEFPQDQLAAVSQGWRLGGAIKLAERKLAEGGLFHADQAIMAWCVGNAKIEPKGNAMLITKQASGSAKIDPLMALFNAAELMARAPMATRSIYEQPAEPRSAAPGAGETLSSSRRMALIWGDGDDD